MSKPIASCDINVNQQFVFHPLVCSLVYLYIIISPLSRCLTLVQLLSTFCAQISIEQTFDGKQATCSSICVSKFNELLSSNAAFSQCCKYKKI